MAVRRLRKSPAQLEVTAFINLIVVLVPFLLSTAVFSRLAVLQLTLPAQTSGVETLKANDLKLEVVIRPDALEVVHLQSGHGVRLRRQGQLQHRQPREYGRRQQERHQHHDQVEERGDLERRRPLVQASDPHLSALPGFPGPGGGRC